MKTLFSGDSFNYYKRFFLKTLCNLRLEQPEKCSCTSRPPIRNKGAGLPAAKWQLLHWPLWKTLKQADLMEKGHLCKSVDRLMTASAIVAVQITHRK